MSDFEAGSKRRATVQLTIGAAIVVLTVVAIWGVFYLVGNQRDFELDRWHNHLERSSNGVSSAAEDWLAQRQQTLIKVTMNPTVQIYLSELALAGFDQTKIPSGDAKRGFVGSYIATLGQKEPFEVQGDGGIALFSGQQALIASSVGFVPRFADYQKALDQLRAGPVGVAFLNDEGSAFTFMVAPIRAMQMPMPGMGEPIGYLVAAFPVGSEFSALLNARSGFSNGVLLFDTSADGVQLLEVAPDSSVWRLLNQDEPKDRELLQIAKASDQLADVEALGQDGALVLARSVGNTSWVVATYIDKSFALGGVTERLRALLLTLLFGLLAVIAAVLALWRHGVSVNALKAARVANAHTEEIVQRERVLQMVADTYPGELVLVDDRNQIVFANARFAGGAGSEAAALIGHDIAHSVPKFVGAEALQVVDRSRRDKSIAHSADALEVGGRFLALSATPLRGAGWQEGGALLSINDVTDTVQAKEKKAQFYWGLVDLLLDAIDQRDPGAAAHSRRVSKISADIMREQMASKEEVETAEIAGALLNAGKLFVPSELLTKSSALDSAERNTIFSGGQKWLGLLSRVPFDLPITEVLADAQALMQNRMTPDKANLIARVIIVANGYVALVSPRTYREAYSHDAAIGSLADNRLMDVQIVETLKRAISI